MLKDIRDITYCKGTQNETQANNFRTVGSSAFCQKDIIQKLQHISLGFLLYI